LPVESRGTVRPKGEECRIARRAAPARCRRRGAWADAGNEHLAPTLFLQHSLFCHSLSCTVAPHTRTHNHKHILSTGCTHTSMYGHSGCERFASCHAVWPEFLASAALGMRCSSPLLQPPFLPWSQLEHAAGGRLLSILLTTNNAGAIGAGIANLMFTQNCCLPYITRHARLCAPMVTAARAVVASSRLAQHCTFMHPQTLAAACMHTCHDTVVHKS
jgi:hypothetical protein